MSEKSVYVRLSGRVQGVGFRRFVLRTAIGFGGVSGWVRNAENGSVEIFMRGEEEKLEMMVAACREGPLWARVDRVDFLPPVARGFLPDITDGKFEVI